MALWWIFLVGEFIGLNTGSTLVTMPSVSNVLPCTDTAENCARNNYNVQLADAASIQTIVQTSDSMNQQAGDLLDTVRALKSSSESLTDYIDPDNSRTSGGQVLTLSTGRKINGVTPFMATLASKIVSATSKRSADLLSLYTSVKNAMDTVVRLLTDSANEVAAQVGTVSSKIQSDITAASVSLRDLFVQADARLTTSARQFDTTQNSAPHATENTIEGSLRLEANDYVSTRTRLGDFLTEIAAMSPDLASYQSNLLSQIQAYQISQFASGTALGSQQINVFTTEIAETAAEAWRKIQGLGSEDPTHPFYSLSIRALGEAKARALNEAMAAANATEQSKLAMLRDAILSTSRGIALVYQPILNDLILNTTALKQTDLAFQADSMRAVNDANTTLAKSLDSWSTFTQKMNTLFNTTGNILTGQTNSITTGLLHQIGDMTQEAGAEVSNMNDLMLQAGTGELEADAVRRAILASSNKQVVSMIGSNEAALNASFKTVSDFMDKSSDKIDHILKVVRFLSSEEVANLNASASAEMRQIRQLINTTHEGLTGLIRSLKTKTQTDIGNDRLVADATYKDYAQLGNRIVNQTTRALEAMRTALRVDLFANYGAKINASVANLNKVIATTNWQAQIAQNFSSDISVRRQDVLTRQGALANNASTRTDQAASRIAQSLRMMQTDAEYAASNLGSNVSRSLASLVDFLRARTTTFAQGSNAIQALFDQRVASVLTNSTILSSQLSSTNTALVDVQAETKLAGTATEADLLSKLKDVVATTLRTIDDRIDSAKSNVSSLLAREIIGQTSRTTNAMNTYATVVPGIAHRVAQLFEAVEPLRTEPESMLANATTLMSEFRGSLEDLRKSILQFSDSNAAQADTFEASLNDTFSQKILPNHAPGLGTLVGDLDMEMASTEEGGRRKLQEGVARGNASVLLKLRSARNKANQFAVDAFLLGNATLASLDKIAESVLAGMEASTNDWSIAANRINASIYSKLDAHGELQNRLSALKTQSVALESEIAQSNIASKSAADALVAKVGKETAAKLDALINVAGESLTAAQKEQALRLLATANVAADSATQNADDLALRVQEAIAAVTTNQGAASAHNEYLKGRLETISRSANSTVEISANEIAAIIAKFRDDSETTRAAIKSQLAAANKAEASISDAQKIWASLKNSSTTIANDELETLADLKMAIFTESDTLRDRLRNSASLDTDSFSSKAKETKDRAIRLHERRASQLTDSVAEFQSVSTNTEAEIAEFDASVSNLRGLVAEMRDALNLRLQKIVAQAVPFRDALGAAAAQDIANITSVP